ncbi:MAG: translation initiation factor IF-2 N-terminal domain-containing protein, partial [Acidobacteria bacterium]|nr:translation initiation factor IF-2 N-terminal domain-containing protein [Acidobacteriota bacterium]
MSTVRIYRVAELLNAPSQEVMDLLKAEAGIEVKSASSTIEEVVARQFVERHARKRNVTLPPAAQMFSDVPAARPGGKKMPGRPPVPEPPKAAPLPPPRLVKAIKLPASAVPQDDPYPAAGQTYEQSVREMFAPDRVASTTAAMAHEPVAAAVSDP